MPLLCLLFEGLTQSPNMSSNLASPFGLLFATMMISLPLVNDKTIGLYLILQLVCCMLLWVRAVRAFGSQSIRRSFEAEAHAASLTWLDVLRFAALGWVLKHVLHFGVGAQMCELYCGVIALRTLLNPMAYVVLRIYGGPAVATRYTGFDPSAFVESMGGIRGATKVASGPAWNQHGQTSRKATSAARRVSSLAPAALGSDAENNNDRCVVVDEGPHFNRTARGCLLPMNE